jgi:hypothetical protein
MARKSILATLLGLAAFAVPNAFADKGGVPHEGSNGQGRPVQEQQQTPAATPQGKALAKGHAKVKSHAKVKTHTAPSAPPATNTHAKAGKTTICHATGSQTNPYVTITISNNAVPAHQRHQDGRDIVPAPTDGCPTAAAAQQQPAQEQPAQQHEQQQSPAATAPASSTTQSVGEDKGDVLGETTSGSSGAPDQVRVLGATTSGRAPSASSAPAALATRSSSSNGLPFTGTDAIIVAILGLAAVLLGVTVRRVTTTRV